MLATNAASRPRPQTLRPVEAFQPVTRFRFVPSPAVQTRRCPPVNGLKVLMGRWTIPILWEMRDGPVRLGQLGRALPGASRKMITETLRRLERQDILIRHDLSGKIKHVEYHLNSQIADEIGPLLDHLVAWGASCERTRKVRLTVVRHEKA